MDQGLKKLLITIGVILGIAIIFTLARYLKSHETYEEQIEKLKTALQAWGEEYQEFLPKNGETITIPLRTLKQSGYIADDFKNPKTRKAFSNELLLTITKKNKLYQYEVLDQESVTEDYDEINKSAPMIILKGNAIEYAELGYTYEEKGYEAITLNGKKADEVKITITSSNKNVSYIDTQKLGTYQITYHVSYAKEESTMTRTVVVRDTEKPTIKMERLTVKPEDVEQLDLMTGVVIEDRSGDNLKVRVFGSLSKIPGKYILTYQVTDSSSNQIEKKRIIRVEE